MYSRKTKIVCSIGPACDNDETIKKMILAGMNIARFNFSHGTHEWHKQAMERVRRVAEALRIPVAILLDTKGPEIRTGLVENDGKITVNTGDKIELVADNSFCTAANGEKLCHISISWKEAPQKMKSGVRVLIADGLVEIDVVEIQGEKIICEAKNSGTFGSRKNVNLIGLHAGLPIMSEKDKDDLRFGAEEDIDFVAASFVSFPEEVVQIKTFLKEVGANARVIAKIENEEGLNNIEEIVKEADGIMIARGDLGVQIPPERIPLAQKAIIRVCRAAGKPVITATQMLDSMIVNPRPTRAELTDVSNAVFDGTDAVMLSGETAGGKYPIESVRAMVLITRTTEQSQEYLFQMRKFDSEYKPGVEVGHMVAHSAYKLARNISAKAVLVPTLHGNTARIIGSYRPEQVVLAVTPDKKVANQLMIQWGVLPVLCQVADDSEMMIQSAITQCVRCGAIKQGDKVLICAGIPISSPMMINTIKVLVVGNILARGMVSGFANTENKKASGRVVHENDLNEIRNQVRMNSKAILVCWRITEDLIPALRVVQGVVSETGSDIPPEQLALINPDLVWLQDVRDALKILENDLSVTIDGEQGLVYEGII